MKHKLIHFTKMHGLGNDFVIINTLNQLFDPTKWLTQLADRHIGIGFDQLLLIEKSDQADYFCRIYNADGSEAEQCGNGLRCVARFIHEEGIHPERIFSLQTIAGIYPLDIQDYEHIRISMGAPLIKNNLVDLNLTEHSKSLPISILSIGNPHAIAKVESLELIPLSMLAPQISAHDYFPDGANVGFMEIINRKHIRLRTFERGVGETFACGSNACAAAVAGIANGWLEEQVQVEFRYGSLLIDWDGENKPIHMTGPATKVYSGIIDLT